MAPPRDAITAKMPFSPIIRNASDSAGLLARLGTWNAVIAAAAVYVVVVAIAGYVMPPVNEVPAAFSAVVLWNFRLASLGMQVILWTTLGLGFGALAAHTLHSRQGAQGLPHRL